MLKKRVRNILLGSEPAPQVVPVGMRDPQNQVRVFLQGTGSPIDVTRRNVVASLRPFCLAVGVESTHPLDRLEAKRLALEFRGSVGEERVLGRIDLRFFDSKPLGRARLNFFRGISAYNFCVSRRKLYMREIYDSYVAWRSGRYRNPHSFRMSTRDLRSLFVSYLCPRPVVLVTVVHGDASNIFPMDLIGPVTNSYFSLALRNTSRAGALIKSAGRVSLADVPIERTALAHALGQHHKEKSIDWSSLPFGISRSRVFGLPVPDFSPRVRDMEVDDFFGVGSHTFFLAREVSSEKRNNSQQMFHMNGFYADWANQ